MHLAEVSSHTRYSFPIRMRRNRKSEAVRKLVQETVLTAEDLVAPFFVVEGENARIPISSMPGVERLSVDLLVKEAEELHERGVQAIALFPVIDPE